MTTYHERYWQAVRMAHQNAVYGADKAYHREVREWHDEYVRIHEREMTAFRQLEEMRKPVPNQAQVDAMAAGILCLARCPECDTPIRRGYHCAQCAEEDYR